MAQKTPIIISDNKDDHEPLAAGDTVTISSVPVSPDADNIIVKHDNGLYAGVKPPAAIASQYVDVENGSDETGDGTQANPIKTLAKAIDNMIPETRGYTVYLHENQEHVLPSRQIEGVDFEITSYPSLQNQPELFEKIKQAWYDKYKTILTITTIDNLYDMATVIPDRVNPVESTDPGGPWGYVTGLNSINGNVGFNCVKIVCGKDDMDVEVSGMVRQGVLTDFDLPGPVSYNVNYCEIHCGSMPLVVQRGAGSNITVNVFGSLITGEADEKGDPVFIKGWGSDAPKAFSMIGEDNDSSNFVTVNGKDYHQKKTTGSIDFAVKHTTGVLYHGDIPLNIDAAWLYKNS